MEVFVARQPIFDAQQNLFAYELLFRMGQENRYQAIDGDQATSEVIFRSFYSIGMEAMTGGKRAFINFTENLLKSEVALLLPKDSLVIELLETVEPTDEIVEACRKLKQAGYILALDDFIFEPKFAPLLDLADIVKVDFRLTQGDERRRVIEQVGRRKIEFLAEKVESRQEFEEAIGMGYSYFQGYFFSKPTVMRGKDIPIARINQVKVLEQLTRSQIDFDEIEKVIMYDVALAYHLLRFINSAAFGLKNEIQSVRHALVMLGHKELIKWISLIALRSFHNSRMDELVVISLVRARFAELLAGKIGLQARAPEMFMMGMFSMIDVFMEKPLEVVLEQLPLPQDIKEALTGKRNVFRSVYELILAYEMAEWEKFSLQATALRIDENAIPSLYQQSVEWADRICSQ